MDDTRTYSSGFYAICATITAAAIGAVYFAYLTLDSFPPDILRIVPVIWLIGAITGLILGLQSVVTNADRHLGLLSVALNIMNIPLAAVFMLGAAMGD